MVGTPPNSWMVYGKSSSKMDDSHFRKPPCPGTQQDPECPRTFGSEVVKLNGDHEVAVIVSWMIVNVLL